MKKQKFSLSLVLALIISAYLAGIPVRVNAGSVGITGASEDSSSSSGDNFNPANSPSFPELAPGVNVEIGGDGGLSTSAKTQNSLNQAIANILEEDPPAIILAILQRQLNTPEAANQLQALLANSGISVASGQTLINALLGLAENQSASASATPSSFPVTDSETPQKDKSWNIDINNLNAAINNYNKIVKESSPEVLQKLANNPDFRAIGKLLKQLRAALNKS